MAVNGNNIYITAGGTLIAATKSNELMVGCETIEIASATSGAWRSFIAGRKEWSMTVSFLVTAVKPGDARSPLNVGSTYTLQFVSRSDSSDKVSGSAICTQCKITSTRGSLCNGTISFKGISSLT